MIMMMAMIKNTMMKMMTIKRMLKSMIQNRMTGTIKLMMSMIKLIENIQKNQENRARPIQEREKVMKRKNENIQRMTIEAITVAESTQATNTQITRRIKTILKMTKWKKNANNSPLESQRKFFLKMFLGA